MMTVIITGNRFPTSTGKMREVFFQSGNFIILPESRGICGQSGNIHVKLDQKIFSKFRTGIMKTVAFRHGFIED